MINLKSLIVENIEVIAPDEMLSKHHQQLQDMVTDSKIHIRSDKELDTVYLIDGNVAGGLWTSFRNDVFSFDTIVGKNYQNQMLGARIVRQGLQMYREIAFDCPDVKLELDVVNARLVEPLKKMGLKVQNSVMGSTIMGYGEN